MSVVREMISFINCRYLSKFDKLGEFPRERKGAEYKRYLGMLLDYFFSFISRVRPLYDLHEAMDVIKREFDTKWAVGDVTGKTVKKVAIASPCSRSKTTAFQDGRKS